MTRATLESCSTRMPIEAAAFIVLFFGTTHFCEHYKTVWNISGNHCRPPPAKKIFGDNHISATALKCTSAAKSGKNQMEWNSTVGWSTTVPCLLSHQCPSSNQCHAVCNLWPPTFQNALGELPPTEGQAPPHTSVCWLQRLRNKPVVYSAFSVKNLPTSPSLSSDPLRILWLLMTSSSVWRIAIHFTDVQETPGFVTCDDPSGLLHHSYMNILGNVMCWQTHWIFRSLLRRGW